MPVQGGVHKVPNGALGEDGADAGNWRLHCDGDVDVDGNAEITGGTVIEPPDAGVGGGIADGDSGGQGGAGLPFKQPARL